MLSNGKVFKRKLEHEGFEVAWAEDGEKGLELIDKRLPDLILLDLMMPKVDGYGVLESLKKHDLHNKTKIIVATNLSQEIDIVKAKENGADDYFVKSDISINEMVEKVRSILG